MAHPIALMTDFGLRDSYVGVMKGVIANIAPSAQVIDLTHAIRPQDVAHGAYTLAISAPYFPARTIFCCVVDPGVGSTRRAVAVEVGDWAFVLPDNGLVTYVVDRWPVHRAVNLTARQYHLPQPSNTFHGRDVFAPVTAHLSTGVDIEDLGASIDTSELHRLYVPGVQRAGRKVSGRVIHVDRFGNLITNLTRDDLQGQQGWQVRLVGGDVTVSGVQSTFADVPPGTPVAYIGSDGYLELAIRNGNAAAQWGTIPGMEVIAERELGRQP